jgi:hypothetical protein
MRELAVHTLHSYTTIIRMLHEIQHSAKRSIFIEKMKGCDLVCAALLPSVLITTTFVTVQLE